MGIKVSNFTVNRQFWFFRPSLPKKSVFQVKSSKNEYHHWFLHVGITLGTKFQFKPTILTFWNGCLRKRYFLSKIEKVNSITESAYSNYSTKFQLKLTILRQLSKKHYFQPNMKKKKLHHWIRDIRISLDTYFHLKLTTLIS